jgi:hypothetical protein
VAEPAGFARGLDADSVARTPPEPVLQRKRERMLAIESAKTATRVSGCGPAGLGQPAGAFLLGWLACYARVSASGEQNVTSG